MEASAHDVPRHCILSSRPFSVTDLEFFFLKPFATACSRFDSLNGIGSIRALVGMAGMAQYAR